MKILITIVAALAVLAGLVFGGAYVYVNTDLFVEHKGKQACIRYFKRNMHNPDSLKVRKSKIVPNEDGSLSIRLTMEGTNAFGGVVTNHGRCITTTDMHSVLDYRKTIEINKSLDAMSEVLQRAAQ